MTRTSFILVGLALGTGTAAIFAPALVVPKGASSFCKRPTASGPPSSPRLETSS